MASYLNAPDRWSRQSWHPQLRSRRPWVSYSAPWGVAGRSHVLLALALSLHHPLPPLLTPPPPADRILVAPSDAKAAVTLLPPAAGHPPRGMETRAAARRRLAAQGGATGTTASARQAVPVGLPAPEPHNGGTAGAEAASSRAIAGGPTTRSASRRLVTAEAVEGLPSTVASCDGAAAPPLTAVTTGRRATRSTTRRGGAASSRGRGGAPSVAAADAHVERQGNGGGRSFQSLN